MKCENKFESAIKFLIDNKIINEEILNDDKKFVVSTNYKEDNLKIIDMIKIFANEN